MPTCNSSDTVIESVKSVLAQTYQTWELIIVDDCSSDNTVALLKSSFNNEGRIIIIENEFNQGAGKARNIAIEKSRGRYIAFLDSDDLWHHQKLEKQIKFMMQNTCSLSYTAYNKIDIHGNVIGSINPPPTITYAQLLKSNVIGCLTAIYDTNSLGKMYMPDLRRRQDMALWLNILKKVEKAYCLSDSLAFYRVGLNSLSSNKFKVIRSQWGFYRTYMNFGLFKSLYFFIFYVCYALKKHY
jgi:glycosyltransferase involved in cell wall biosynthesis